MMLYITAFTIGILGSFHCVGMCGPIALAIPMKDRRIMTLVRGMTLYNLGRTTTYTLMGGIVGTLGGGLVWSGMQQYLSILTGVMMIALILLPKGNLNWLSNIPWLFKFNQWVKRTFRKFLTKKTWESQYILGLVNGMLPCGLVYIAMTGALAAGDWKVGALYMILFSLGTWPMLLFTGVAGRMISISLRQKLVKAIPIFVVIVGMMFILRGMNLGIPYLSPKISNDNQKTEVICH